VRTIPGNKCVAGLTILCGQLYVVRSQASNIEVYDVGSAFQPVHELSVQGLRQPTDIVASQTAAVVYVSDAVGFIYVVDPSGTVHSRLKVNTYTVGLIIIVIIIFGPGNGSQWPRTLFLLGFLLLSHVRSPKALSFLGRSS